MPTNLYGYGINDNFNLESSHVLPAMICKMYLARLLDENNYTAIKQDLQLENTDTYNIEQQIKIQLAKYGISKDQ